MAPKKTQKTLFNYEFALRFSRRFEHQLNQVISESIEIEDIKITSTELLKPLHEAEKLTDNIVLYPL